VVDDEGREETMADAPKKTWTILIVREDATPVTTEVEAATQAPAFEEVARIIGDRFYRTGSRSRVFMSNGEGLLEYGIEEVLLRVGRKEV
jgi:hypothetical protein